MDWEAEIGDLYKLVYVWQGGAAHFHGMHSVADTSPKSCDNCILVPDSDKRNYPSDQSRGVCEFVPLGS